MKVEELSLSFLLYWNLWRLYTISWTAKHVGSPDSHSLYYVALYWVQSAHLSPVPFQGFTSKVHLKLASAISAICWIKLEKLTKAAGYRCSKEVLTRLFIKIQCIFSMLPSSSVSMYDPRELKLTSTQRIYTHIHTHFIHNSPKLVATPNACQSTKCIKSVPHIHTGK